MAIDEKISHNAALNPNTPVYLNLPTFRMVILADETYELLFSSTLRESTHLDRPLDLKFNPMRNLRDMFDGLLADGRKVASKVRTRMDSRASNNMNNTNNSSNNSIKSGKSKNDHNGEDDDRDDDFGIISIDENDKNLLLGTEAQALIDPIKNESASPNELKNFMMLKKNQENIFIIIINNKQMMIQ